MLQEVLLALFVIRLMIYLWFLGPLPNFMASTIRSISRQNISVGFGEMDL